jgi:hypothetical protein
MTTPSKRITLLFSEDLALFQDMHSSRITLKNQRCGNSAVIGDSRMNGLITYLYRVPKRLPFSLR